MGVVSLSKILLSQTLWAESTHCSLLLLFLSTVWKSFQAVRVGVGGGIPGTTIVEGTPDSTAVAGTMLFRGQWDQAAEWMPLASTQSVYGFR